MKISYDTSKFDREMKNIFDYSLGFFEGIEAGKEKFLENVAVGTIDYMKQFVDSMARVSPEILHHVYEWSMAGSPDARLFDLNYSVSSGGGISISSTFRQSVSVKRGSNVPFYDKARIMEYGIPVRIEPSKSKVLVFEEDGQTVFTQKPISIPSPGGEATTGSLERTLDIFIKQYFSQSFLSASGIMDRIQDVSVYKKNLSSGAKQGRARGKQIGYSWIVKAGVIS